MIAVYINCIAIIVGTLIGLLIGSRLKEGFKEVVFASSGLVTLIIGINMALETQSYLVLLFSVIVGGLVGYILGIERGILRLGDWMERKGSRSKVEGVEEKGGSLFARGFLNASVLFCSGAMSVVGSIAAGTQGDYTLILIKSVMDGAMAIVFASVYGIGVMASIVVVLLYQGFFTLAGGWIAPLLGEAGLVELSAAGGILLIMIAFGLLKVKEFKTGNFIPALLFAPFFSALGAWITRVVPFLGS
ncbi:MAG: DUF554 domain-containing protein [Sphaerochaetaceae bacterium]|jgi:uncharacterized membrane protein YqgA involved in biofilm formation|nr:DUF554 domain-containing protein [Sphaerochaetaceae bacterium]HHU89208.1 DUF554 domain-containing protein [Spirochaetales bacterium]